MLIFHRSWRIPDSTVGILINTQWPSDPLIWAKFILVDGLMFFCRFPRKDFSVISSAVHWRRTSRKLWTEVFAYVLYHGFVLMLLSGWYETVAHEVSLPRIIFPRLFGMCTTWIVEQTWRGYLVSAWSSNLWYYLTWVINFSHETYKYSVRVLNKSTTLLIKFAVNRWKLPPGKG